MFGSYVRRSAVASALGISLAVGAASTAIAQEKPQYGGTLEITSVNRHLSVLTWDPADWNWKNNHDNGQLYEQLFSADLTKARRRGGKHPFYADAWVPSDAIRGELAETWEWKKDPLRVEIKLRKGIMFPEKAGVMQSREFVADDVVFSFNRSNTSPKKIATYFDHVEKVEATDKHTVVFTMKSLQCRVGLSLRLGLLFRDLSEGSRRCWRDQLEEPERHRAIPADRLCPGQHEHLFEEPDLLGQGKIGGVEFKLPFVDKFVYRNIKDEATAATALRTGKLDIHELMRWSDMEQLKKSVPQLQVVEVAVDERPVPVACASIPSRSTISVFAVR